MSQKDFPNFWLAVCCFSFLVAFIPFAVYSLSEEKKLLEEERKFVEEIERNFPQD